MSGLAVGGAGAPTVLVLAKVPVPGRVKTRLAVTIGAAAAARVAAAALLDTIDACVAAVGARRCRIALDGDLAAAVGADELAAALDGWTVAGQVLGALGERIAAACGAVEGPVLQIGMDTPHVGPELLTAAAARLRSVDAVLGPAADGGWWLLGLNDPRAASAVAPVPMSTGRTGALTRAALVEAGLSVGDLPALRDIDRCDDLAAVAAKAPATRTARVAREVLG